MAGGNSRKLPKVKTALDAAGFWGVDERWLRDEGICTE